MANYTIDGSDVNDREDWRHELPRTELTAQRFEGFPGYGGLYPVVGEPTGIVFTVLGFLQASGFDALHKKLFEAYAIRDAVQTHTVRIHDASYSGMLLVEVAATGGSTAFRRPDGNVWVRCPVRYLWRELVPGGGA
ncbi:MAG: hypothetical protein AAF333_13355 [Planctomycetota bacterium]